MSEPTRPRILLVTRNLPPLIGGMERLNWHMAEELAKVADVHVVGPAGSAVQAPPGVTVREAPLKPLWKFLLRARSLARQEARAWQPDVVLAGSGLTAPLALSAAKLCAAKAVVYAHGLDVAVNNVVYRALWFRAIRRMHRVIANSRPTAQLCRDIGIAYQRIGIVRPGVDIPDLTSAQQQAKQFRDTYQLGNKPLLLSVGRLSERKGLQEFVTQSLPGIIAGRSDAMLLIVGDAPSQALHARAQSAESIQAAADAAGVGEHIRFLGKVSEVDLLAFYRTANVHVFPIRAIPGDPEGFGMVAVEAAANGLPTVAFATGGVVDAVAEGQSGHLVPANDYTAFADAVLQVLDTCKPGELDCINFARQFAWPLFGNEIVMQLNNDTWGKNHPTENTND